MKKQLFTLLIAAALFVMTEAHAWNYTFKNGLNEELTLTIMYAAPNVCANETIKLNPGEEHIFYAGACCISGLNLRIGDDEDGILFKSHGGQGEDAYGSLPTTTAGMNCQHYKAEIVKNKMGKVLLQQY